jgi:hypothetical protein
VSPVSLEIEPTRCRRLSVRYRVVFDARGARHEPLEVVRALGLPLGDIIPFKPEVDVFVEGRAHPPHQRARETDVRLRMGSIDVTAVAFGERRIVRRGDRLEIGDPAPLQPFGLTAQYAYGGRVGDVHYPRNPVGRGFVLDEQEAEGALLPQLEDPEDRLTRDRLVAEGDRWWRMPRPLSFDATLPTSFPRGVLLGLVGMPAVADPAALGEVRDGDVPPLSPGLHAPSRAFVHEARRRFRLPRLEAGMEARLDGCLPQGAPWRWRVPTSPVARLFVEGRELQAGAVAQTVRLRPEADEVAVTYAIEHELPRAFVPGLHARIPIAVEVLGARHEYVTPEPVLAAVRRGLANERGIRS